MTKLILIARGISPKFDGNKIILIMKTTVVLTQQRKSINSSKNILHLLVGICMIATVAFSSVFAQTTNTEVNVTGIVTDEIGPLPGVNIVLLGGSDGAVTDTDGSFTFPKTLKPGDILVFSYLGYETRRIKIKEDSSVLNIKMVSEAIDIVGAPASNKPYKSKRSR